MPRCRSIPLTRAWLLSTLWFQFPFPAVAAPPGSKDSSEPTGASMTGRRSFMPRKLAVQSTLETSRSTRGRSAIASSAARLRRSVVSLSVAPTR